MSLSSSFSSSPSHEAEVARLKWVAQYFRETKKDPDAAAAVAAVSALTEVIKRSKANTMMELEMELKRAADILKHTSGTLSVSSGCELFTRFVTRTSLDIPDFVECKKILIERGEQYTRQSAASRQKIGKLANSFIREGATVLTHGYSRVVLGVLLQAAQLGKRFKVIVTEARPDDIGYNLAKRLQEANIPATLITDAAVAHIMDRVDMVLIGAEGIAENGGIINKIGTYQISIVAKALNKPFYVAAESFKFMRFYPLNQLDFGSFSRDQNQIPFHFPTDVPTSETKLYKIDNPTHDYTPPSYITLLVTDLGVLTPSAVSDELIKLYY